MKPIIDPQASLTFSDYYNLRATANEVVEHFGYELVTKYLPLPAGSVNSDLSKALEKRMARIVPFVNLDNEAARREILISPVLYELAAAVQPRINIEYPLYVTDQLKGTVDYYFKSQASQILVVEAKAADTEKGFKQLMAELIAFQIRDEVSTSIYGAVTTGQTWHFSCLHPDTRVLERDINFYTEPRGVEDLLSVLIGILSRDPASLPAAHTAPPPNESL